jgi:putative membrane protein
MIPSDPPTPAPVPATPVAGAKSNLRHLIGAVEQSFGKHKPPADPPLAQMNSNQLAMERTELGVERTLMAADRSLMAWIRTALSMISFGFTIYKLLQGFEAAGTELGRASSPRTIGLFLTGLGTVSMIFGTVEYWYRLETLRTYREFPLWRPSFTMAVLMSAMGLFLFVSIIFKVL